MRGKHGQAAAELRITPDALRDAFARATPRPRPAFVAALRARLTQAATKSAARRTASGDDADEQRTTSPTTRTTRLTIVQPSGQPGRDHTASSATTPPTQ